MVELSVQIPLTSPGGTYGQAAYTAVKRASRIRGQLLPYQALALYELVKAYDRPGCNILEIGTFVGHSTAVMAQAAPRAWIVTLNPAGHEARKAINNLRDWPNVRVVGERSWDYLEHDGTPWDVIFVDGDHKHIMQDMPWWDRVRCGGLMLFHDYSPPEAANPCPRVYSAVNYLGELLGRPPDVLIVGRDKVGMAGFYVKLGDPHWRA